MAEQTFLKDLGIEGLDETRIPIATTIDESAILKNEMAAEDNGRGFIDSLGTAYDENQLWWSARDTIDKYTTDASTPITNFTPELVKQLTEGLPTIAVEEVLEEAQVNGLRRAMKVREQHLKTVSNRALLASDGWTGVAANAFSLMFDPTEWAAILASGAAISAIGTPLAGGTAVTAGALKKAYNVKKAFTVGAAVTAAESAAFEAIRANVKYDVDANDVLIAGGAGALIGGGLNAGRIAFKRAGDRAKIARKVLRGDTLTPAEKQFHDAFNVDALAEKIITRELDGDKFIESVDGIDATKLTTEDVSAIPKIAGFNMFGLRELLSTGARLGNSEMGWARYAGRILGMNTVGYKGGKVVTNESASEIAERLQMVYRNNLSNTLPNAQLKWKKNTGASIEEFNREVSRYVRGIVTDVPDEVRVAGDAIKRTQDELARLAIKYDVAGFSKGMLKNHPNYMSRIFNDEKIRQLRIRLGDDADDKIAQLVEQSMRRGQPDIESFVKRNLESKNLPAKPKAVAAYIKKIAVAYTKSITDPKSSKVGAAGAHEMNLEDLADIFRAGGFDEAEIDDITDFFTKTNIPKSHKRARHRMILDEGTTIKVSNATGEIDEIRFTDLLEEDAEQLVNSYIFQLSGAIGLARNGINTNQIGSSFDTLMSKIRKEGKDKNIAQDEVDKSVNAAQFMYDGITGRLANREDVSNRVRDVNVAVRAYSFAVNMGMSGMSAMMELTNALFEYSFTTLLKSAPAYRQLFQTASKGRLPDGLMRELVETMGAGNEVALGKWNAVTRFDTEDVGAIISPERAWYDKKGWSTKKLGAAAEKGAYGSQKFVAYWSGLTGVTQTLRRLSMMNFTNEWALAARKGKIPFSAIKRQQLGISDEMAIKIRDTMNSNLVERAPNGRITKLNIENWKEDVREAFSAAGFKDARTNVQETNIASSNKWLKSSQMGRTMFQFMNFTLGSLEQQTQRLGVRIGQKDAAVAKVLVSAAAMGGLMYITRVHLNAAGRSDADEYIKERMQPANWALGALSQIGAASMFSYIYQLTTGAMSGNTYAITPPAYSIVQNLFTSAKNIAEGDMTEAEIRKLLRVLPFQSLYGARQAINALADELD